MDADYFTALADAAKVKIDEGADPDSIDPDIDPGMELGQVAALGAAWQNRLNILRHDEEQRLGRPLTEEEFANIKKKASSPVSRQFSRKRQETLFRFVRGEISVAKVLEDIVEDSIDRDMRRTQRSEAFYVDSIKQLETELGKVGQFLEEKNAYTKQDIIEALGKIVESKVLADTAKPNNGLSDWVNDFLDLLRKWVGEVIAFVKLGNTINQVLSDKQARERLGADFVGMVENLAHQNTEFMKGLQRESSLRYTLDAATRKPSPTPTLTAAMEEHGEAVTAETEERERQHKALSDDIREAVEPELSASVEQIDEIKALQAEEDALEFQRKGEFEYADLRTGNRAGTQEAASGSGSQGAADGDSDARAGAEVQRGESSHVSEPESEKLHGHRGLLPSGRALRHLATRVHRFHGETKANAEKRGFYTGHLYELRQNDAEAAQAFADCINAAKASRGVLGDCVYTYEVEEYRQMRLFLTPDGKAGIALKPNGDMVSVFTHREQKNTLGGKTVHALIELAINEGAVKADCYGSFLVMLYGRHGFRAVAKDAFNAEFATESMKNRETMLANFPKEDGKPDVVYLVYEGNRETGLDDFNAKYTPTYQDRLGYSDYDTCCATQDAGVKECRKIEALPAEVKQPVLDATSDVDLRHFGLKELARVKIERNRKRAVDMVHAASILQANSVDVFTEAGRQEAEDMAEYAARCKEQLAARAAREKDEATQARVLATAARWERWHELDDLKGEAARWDGKARVTPRLVEAPADDAGFSSATRVAPDFTPEMQDIIEKGKASGHIVVNEKGRTICLASNGKPSNLDIGQWAQVRTKSFKAWFGDWEDPKAEHSQVIDENGEPLVVYHGTRQGGFREFDETMGGENTSAPKGSMFFTASRSVARSYGKYNDEVDLKGEEDEDGDIYYDEEQEGVYSCFLNLRQPEEVDFYDNNWNHDAYIVESFTDYAFYDENGDYKFFYDYDEALEFAREKYAGETNSAGEPLSDEELAEKVIYYPRVTDDIVRDALDGGWADGVIIRNVDDNGHWGSGGISDDYIVFSPKSVKSATQNVGTFNPNDADITHSVSVAREVGIMQDGKLEAANGTLYDMGGASFAIRARHASPHSGIRKFLTAFMGTGEGSQMEGWGLYFSTSREAHEWYVEQFSDFEASLTARARHLPNYKQGLLVSYTYAASYKSWEEFKKEKMVSWQEFADNAKAKGNKAYANYAEKILKFLKNIKNINDYVSIHNRQASEYEVMLNVERNRDNLLRWETAPPVWLSEALGMGTGWLSGMELYEALADDLGGSPKQASEKLLNLGIKGIEYRDGGSRDSNEKVTYNYVIFNEADVKVVRVKDAATGYEWQDYEDADATFSVIGEHAQTWDKYKDKAFAGRDDGKMRAELDASKARVLLPKSTLSESLVKRIRYIYTSDEYNMYSILHETATLAADVAKEKGLPPTCKLRETLDEDEFEDFENMLQGTDKGLDSTVRELFIAAHAAREKWQQVLSEELAKHGVSLKGHPHEETLLSGLFGSAKVHDAKTTVRAFDGKYLDEVLDFPELFEAYPELRFILMARDLGLGFASASYSHWDIAMRELGKGDGKSPRGFINMNENVMDWGNEEKARSIILHEVQHAIQDIEGFASGGNIKQFKADDDGMVDIGKQIVDWSLKQARAAFDEASPETQEKFRAINRARLNREYDKANDIEDGLQLGERILWRKYDDLATNARQIHQDGGKFVTPEEAYYRLAGEIEARAVEHRMGWSAEGREATPFNHSLDYSDGAVVSFAVSLEEGQRIAREFNALEKGKGVRVSVPDVFALPMDKARAHAREMYRVLQQETQEGNLPLELPNGIKAIAKGKGFREVKHHSADRRVLAAVCGLRDLCRNSMYINSSPNSESDKGGKEDIVQFHYYIAKARFEGAHACNPIWQDEAYVSIVIAEDAEGNCFYDLNASNEEQIINEKTISEELPTTRVTNTAMTTPGMAYEGRILKTKKFVNYVNAQNSQQKTAADFSSAVRFLDSATTGHGGLTEERMAFAQTIAENVSKMLTEEIARFRSFDGKVHGSREKALVAIGAVYNMARSVAMLMPEGYRVNVRPWLNQLQVFAELAASGKLDLTADMASQDVRGMYEAHGNADGESNPMVEWHSKLVQEHGNEKVNEVLAKILSKVGDKLTKMERDAAVESIKNLLRRLEPQRDPKTGKLKRGIMSAEGYDEVAKAAEAMQMSAEELDAKLTALEASIAKAQEAGNEDEVLRLQGLHTLYSTYGDLKSMSLAQVVAAYENLQELVKWNRWAWEEALAGRRFEQLRMVDETVRGLGGMPGLNAEHTARMEKPLRKRLRNVGDVLKSFPQVLATLDKVGAGALADSLRTRLNTGMEGIKTAERERWVKIEAVSRKTLGKSWRKCMNMLHEVQQTGIPFDQPLHRSVTLSRTYAQELVEMTPEQRKAEWKKNEAMGGSMALARYSEEAVAAMEEELAKGGRSKDITVRFVEEVRHVDNLELSKGQAMYALLMYEQPTYTEQMQAQGYTEEFMEKLRAWMGEEVIAFAYGLRDIVAENTPKLKEVYERQFGVPFPAEENYFPAKWIVPQQNDELMTALAGFGGAPGASTGFLKPRVQHGHPLDTSKDALQVMLQAMTLSDAWMHTQDIVADLNAYMRDRKFDAAMVTALGKDGYANFKAWVELLKNGGARQVVDMGAAQSWVDRLYGASAMAVLGFRIQTLFRQFGAIFNGLMGAYDISTAEFVGSLVRQLTGKAPMSYRRMMKSDFIRNRKTGHQGTLQGQAMRPSGEMVSSFEAALEMAMRPMEEVDSRLTASGLVPVWNAYYRRAVKAGASEAEATQDAWVRTIECANRASQPIGWVNKTKLAQDRSITSRAVMFMLSEDLNKMGLCMSLWGGGHKAKALRAWMVYGACNALISAMLDALCGDPDDWEKAHWWEYVVSAVYGPLASCPGVGEAVEALGTLLLQGVGNVAGIEELAKAKTHASVGRAFIDVQGTYRACSKLYKMLTDDDEYALADYTKQVTRASRPLSVLLGATGTGVGYGLLFLQTLMNPVDFGARVYEAQATDE